MKNGLIVCRCEEVTQADIENAIEEGFESHDAIKKRTRAGMGLCQGRICSRLVTMIVSKKTGKSWGKMIPSRFRPPIRPLKIELFCNEKMKQGCKR